MQENSNRLSSDYHEVAPGIYHNQDGSRIVNYNNNSFTTRYEDGQTVTSIHNPMFDGPMPEPPNTVFNIAAIRERIGQLDSIPSGQYVMGVDPYRRGYEVNESSVVAISVHSDGSRTARHFPIIPEGFQRTLQPNILAAMQPYQAFYNSVMAQLESVLQMSRAGASNNEQVNTLTEMAERTRREMESAIGISRERQGRTQEQAAEDWGSAVIDNHRMQYPMTPQEAFERPITPHGEGIMSQINNANRVTYSQLTRETLEQHLTDLFYGQPEQRTQNIVIRPRRVGYTAMQTAMRIAEEEERAYWYGSAEPRKTRRDKPKPMKDDSPYWSYQTFD